MPELILLPEEDLWTIVDPLIDRLEKLSTNSDDRTEDVDPKDYRFLDENMLLDQIVFKQGQIATEETKMESYAEEAASLAEFRKLFAQKEEKPKLENLQVAQAQEVADLEQKLTEVTNQLASYNSNTDAENEEYKKLVKDKENLDIYLAIANTTLAQTNTAIEQIGDLDVKLTAEKQNFREIRQRRGEEAGTIPEVTSLLKVGILETDLKKGQEATQKTLNDYQVTKNRLETDVKRLERRYKRIRVAMREKLEPLKDLSESKSSNVNFEYLRESLNEMADVTFGKYKEIIRDIARNATAAEFDKKRQNEKAVLSQIFADNAPPGTKYEEEVGAEIGINKFLGSLSVDGYLSIRLTLSVEVDDQERYKVSRSLKDNAQVTGRGHMELNDEKEAEIRLAVKDTLAKEAYKTYDSREAFIEGESASISTEFLNYSRDRQAFSREEWDKMDSEEQAIAYQEIAIASKNRLEQGLRLTKLLTNTQQVKVADLPKITYLRAENLTKSLDAQASTAVEFANNLEPRRGLQVDISSPKNYQQKVVHLIDDVTQHPTIERFYAMENPKAYQFSFSEDNSIKAVDYEGVAALKKLNDTEDFIDHYQQQMPSDETEQGLAVIRGQLKKNLEVLAREYQTFVQAENEITLGDKAKQLKFRDELRKARGVKDSASYLKAVSLQYASLRRVYDKTFTVANPPDPNDQAFMDGFEQDLRVPKFHLSDQAYAQVFQVEQRNQETEVVTMRSGFTKEGQYFKASGDNSQAVIPDVYFGFKRVSTIKLNNGATIAELSLSFNVPAGVQADHFVAKMLQLPEIQSVLGTEANRQEVEQGLVAALKSATSDNLELKLQGSNGGWHTKYVRGYKVSDIEEPIPEMARIQGKNLSTTQAVPVFERPGVNSLAYITDVYRVKKLQTQGADDWKAYDEEHQMLDQMVANLKATDSNISSDLQSWLQGMDTDQDRDLVQEVTQKLAMLQGSNDTDLQANTDAFKEVFVRLIAQKTSQEDAPAKQRFQTRRTAPRQDVRVYAAELISRRMQDIIDTYNLPPSDWEAIDKMVDWAKKNYKRAVLRKQKNPNDAEADTDLQESFQTLKSVFGIQYTTNVLEGLISSKNPLDQSQAISLLDTQLSALLYKQTKVYLDEGLAGELTMDADGKLKIKPIVAKGKGNRFDKDDIDAQVHFQIGDFAPIQEATKVIDKRGIEVNWQPTDQKEKGMNRLMRAASSRVQSLGFGKTISSYINDVLRNTYGLNNNQSILKRTKSMFTSK